MARLFPQITQAEAAALLNEAGIDMTAREIQIERRDDRWRAILPAHRMVWLPAKGAERLAVDRRILRLLEECCSFIEPRIVHEFGREASAHDRAGRCRPVSALRQAEARPGPGATDGPFARPCPRRAAHPHSQRRRDTLVAHTLQLTGAVIRDPLPSSEGRRRFSGW